MKNSVHAEVSRTGRKDVAYSPYGHRPDEPSVSCELAYNGERREERDGRYILGSGYRVFSPVLMRFNSPDSWSPFGEGGVNAYAYCYGNPIMYSDKTGHAPMFGGWMSSIMRLISKNATRVKRFFTDVPDSSNFTRASSKVFPNARKGDVTFVKTADGISRNNPIYQSNTSANNVVSEHFGFLNRYGSGSSSGSASSTRSSVSSHVYEQIKPSLTARSTNPSVRPPEPPPRNISVKKPGNVRSEVKSKPPTSREIERFRDDAWHRKHEARVRSRDKFAFNS
nr:RHS repeat-associated core domain-containing protein [Pseudomonas mohnii]